MSSSGYAVAIPSVRIDTGPGAVTLPRRMLGDVRLLATAPDGDSVFVGIAPAGEVNRYLGGVARTVPDAAWNQGRDISGNAPTAPPTDLAIWDASAVGPGTQALTWAPRPGDWAVVLMKPDGSADVSAEVRVGAELPWLGKVGVAVLILGLVLLAVGVSLVAKASSRASRLASGTPRAEEPPDGTFASGRSHPDSPTHCV